MFKNIKVAFFGSSSFSVIVLEKLKKLGVIPDLIVTLVDKPQGRKLILTPNEVKVWAENNSLEYITPEKLRDNQEVFKKLSDYQVFIVASYGKILPEILVNMPKYKTINIHPSLLPKYRGPSPLQEQILNDEENVGVSVMIIDKEVDHGGILSKEKVNISNWPIGFNELEKILAEKGAEMLAKILPDYLSGKALALEQNHDEATFTKKFEKADGLINLHDDSRKNYLKYLAFENWPGVFFEEEYNGKKIIIKIKEAKFENNEFKLLKIVPEGKKEMNYSDYLRGKK